MLYNGRHLLGVDGLKKMNRGFLGPIGDDLPSLIPLLFALMMFFYVFTFTWNVFDQKGAAFNDSLEALRVANTLKGNNYLRGIGSFNERCTEAQSIKRIKFMVGLLPLSTGPGQNFSGIDLETIEDDFFESGDEKFFCTNLPEDSEDYPGPESVNLSIRSFPVALEFHNETTGMFYVRPMLLTAVTWR